MKKMTKEQFAELLNGNEHLKEMTYEQEQTAKQNNLLVLFVDSHELLEMRGAIHDEVGACDGGDFALILKGETFSDDEDLSISHESECIQILPLSNEYDNGGNPRLIRAEWCPEDRPDLSWRISSNLPYSSFTIMDEGKPYCEGIIIYLYEVQPINQ